MEKKGRFLLCYFSAAATAFLLCYLQGSFPNPVTAILAPVSDSPWETGKLLFWPYLVGALLEWRMSGKEGSRSGHCFVLVAMPLLLTAIRWACPALPAAVLAGIILAGGIFGYARFLRRCLWGGELLWYTLAILLGIAYLLFTALPPLGGPFTDPADVSAMATIPF